MKSKSLCFAAIALFLAYIAIGALTSAEDTIAGHSETDESLVRQNDNTADQYEKPLFYLFAKPQVDSQNQFIRQRSFFEKGIENVDISDAIWKNKPTILLDDEQFVFKGYPVTKTEFQKTLNFRLKRLLKVTIEEVDFGDFSFEDWILKDVYFDKCDLAHCNFTNAILLSATFSGFDEFFEDQERFDKAYFEESPLLNKIPNDNREKQLSFSQFSSTWNYKRNEFCDLELWWMDLSDWDFSNKDLSSMKFSRCSCARQDGSSSKFDGANLALHNYDQLRLWEPTAREFKLKQFFPARAAADDFYKTTNYNSRKCDFVDVRIPGINLTSQNLDYGGVSIYPDVALSNTTIKNARVSAYGIDYSTPKDIIALNEKIYSTKSYKDGDLRGVEFQTPLINCDLSNQNLSGCFFCNSLKGAVLDNAIISGCNFKSSKDLAQEQIKSTWNYKNNRMNNVVLPYWLQFKLQKESFYRSNSFKFKKLQKEDFGISEPKRAPELELKACFNRFGITFEESYRKSWRDLLNDLDQIKSSIGKKFYFPYPCVDDWDFTDMDLSDVVFAPLSMKNANFTNANIEGICFQEKGGVKYNPPPEKPIIRPVPFCKEQLESTASYKERRLVNITFSDACEINGIDLSGCDLSGSIFFTDVRDINFTDAIITNCVFGGRYQYHLNSAPTVEQIKSTWNYKHGKMEGISLPENLRKDLGLPKEGNKDSPSRDSNSND